MSMKLTYTDATEIHSEKYNSNNGFYAAHFFYTNTMHDLVFKITDTEEEYPFTLEGLNLVLHKDQSISLISVDDKLIGYIDKKTKKYYYLTKNFTNYFGLGLKLNWQTILVFIFILIIAVYNSEVTNGMSFFIIAGLMILYWVYHSIANYILERKMDQLIKNI